jgi:hypothetical protein
MLDIIEHAQMRDWYAAAALSIMLLLQLAKRKPGLNLLAKVPKGWRWTVPLLMGAASVFVGSFADGLPLADALRATLVHGLGVGFLAMGGDAAMAESPLPWSGGKAGMPPPRKKQPRIFDAALLVLVALLLTGCPHAEPKFTAGETECLAKVETNEDIELAKCANQEMTEAEAETCVDGIMDHYDREAEKCLSEY